MCSEVRDYNLLIIVESCLKGPEDTQEAYLGTSGISTCPAGAQGDAVQLFQ